MTPKKAKRVARMRLGGLTQLKETNRELRDLPIIETFLQERALRGPHCPYLILLEVIENKIERLAPRSVLN